PYLIIFVQPVKNQQNNFIGCIPPINALFEVGKAPLLRRKPVTSRRSVTPNDLSAFWMPFTANRQFKQAPRMFAGAKDMYYTTTEGRQVLDGTAGLWCVNAGHCRPKITEAIKRQAEELDYAPA